MSEVEKLTIEIAAQFMAARISAGGGTDDTMYAVQCANLAREIVKRASNQL